MANDKQEVEQRMCGDKLDNYSCELAAGHADKHKARLGTLDEVYWTRTVVEPPRKACIHGYEWLCGTCGYINAATEN